MRSGRAIVFTLVGIWMLAAMVVAVKHALDYRRTARALAVCVLAAAVSFGLAFGVSTLFARQVQ
jgi:hypothetical protein